MDVENSFSSYTTTDHDASTVKTKRKKKERRKPTLGEILNPRYLEDMEAANATVTDGICKNIQDPKIADGEAGLRTTITCDTKIVMLEKEKIAKTGSKREEYGKIGNDETGAETIVTCDAKNIVLESDGFVKIANRKTDSSRTATIDAKTVSKLEDCVKVSYGATASETIATRDAKSIVSESDGYVKIANGETDSSRNTIIDVKTVSEVEDCRKIDNGVTRSSLSMSSLIGKRKKGEKPTLGEILNPRYLEELEIAEEKQALKRARNELLNQTNQEAHKKTEDKEIFKITPSVTTRKMLLIFDVNGLLADVVRPAPKDRIADKYIPQRAIFKRPFLDDFLCFCFERFHVAIWSSRKKNILKQVVDFLLGDLQKELLFIWDAARCTKSWTKTLESKHKFIVFKKLSKLWEDKRPSDTWAKGTFNESNTLLLDDSPYKALLNPKHSGIFPLSYSYKNTNDDFLGPKGDLRMYLEGLAASDNMKTYVEQHPFGQGAIDETNPHWDFYLRVLSKVSRWR